MKLKSILTIGAAALAISAQGQSSFAFTDNAADWPWAGRSHVSGVVTGILYGLPANGINVLPTSIQFTSNLNALGMTSSLVSAFTVTLGSGFTMSNGSVTAADVLINFNDPGIGPMQLRFDYVDVLSPLGANVLHWNGSSGPVAGMGNSTGGFSGATYSIVATPEPSTLALAGLGGLGMFFARRRK